MIVTFLYRIQGVTGRSYGKYIGKAPLYDEGMDRGMAEILFPLFHQLYPDQVKDSSDVSVGILFVDREAKDYYSEEERHVFDLLYCQWSTGPADLFVDGVSIKL